MSMFLECAGSFYEKNGHPEVGRGFKALGKLGEKIGMPPTFAIRRRSTEKAKDPDEIYEELIKTGVADRTATFIARSINPTRSRPASGIKRASDITLMTNKELKQKVKGLGEKTIAELREIYPHVPSSEGISWPGKTLGEQYPGTDGIKHVANIYMAHGYREVGTIITALGELGKERGMPPTFEEPQTPNDAAKE